MTPAQWQLVEAAFDEASDAQGDTREALIRNFGEAHPKLVQRLRDLLDADAAEVDLQAPIVATVRALTDDTEDPWIGKDIGVWTVQERIAAGGMGAVFLARRNDAQFEQQAAIKIMAAQLLAPDAIARFRAERQILARLNHRFIAKLIDGGSTDEKLPYLVMEFVDGLPIDEHCDAKRLSVRERLELFQKVCDAVDYAHRNLVVHRDLKPSNIMINEHDEPRLLDFGIAKLLEGGDAMATMAVTRQGMQVMTPEYASPEQVLGHPITIATDVYALGVLLYRLLCGHHPYAGQLTTSVSTERAICKVDPRLPSARVTQAVDEDDTLRPARMRRTSEARLTRDLRGDLDNIVLKAMRKEPQHRYGSIQHLADDIERYLNDEPVAAHPPQMLYRLNKFVRRNALAVSLSALAGVALTATIGFYTVRVTQERDRAQLEADKASQVSDFVAGLFSTADPNESLGEIVTARSLLDLGVVRLGELDGQPTVQAAMQDVMGEAYRGLGLFIRSGELFEQARTTRSHVLGGDHPDTLKSTRELADIKRRLGEFVDAETLFRETLASSVQKTGSRSAVTARIQHGLALTLSAQAQYEEAGEHFRTALDIENELNPGATFTKAEVLDDYGRYLEDTGRNRESIETLQRAIAMFVDVRGDNHPSVLNAMQNLGYAYLSAGEPQRGKAVLQDMLGLSLKVYGEEHPFSIGSVATLATAHYDLGDYVQAETMYRDALTRFEALFGERHPETAIGANNLASSLQKQGRYAEAEHYYRLGLERNQMLYDGDHHEIATGYSNLGVHLMREGDTAAAEEPVRLGLEMRRRLLGDDHPNTMTSVSIYSVFLQQSGSPEAALPLVQQVLEFRRDRLGPDHPLTARETGRYGLLMYRLGRLEEARAALERSLAIQVKAYPEGHRDRARNLLELGRVLESQGDTEGARTQFDAALVMYRSVVRDDHPDIATALIALGEFETRQNQYQQARVTLELAKTIRLANFSAQDWRIAQVDSALGETLIRDGECKRGRALVERGHAALATIRGNVNPLTRTAAARLSLPC